MRVKIACTPSFHPIFLPSSFVLALYEIGNSLKRTFCFKTFAVISGSKSKRFDFILIFLINSLRNALPNNDITTMTYHWLIGVSSATDSRGITTHFSFDNQGRLSTVKDYNGYFIRKYDYHYKQ